MVWVVDGTRLKRDYSRFIKEWRKEGISEVHETDNLGVFEVWFPEFCFPDAWLRSTVSIVFDFRGDGSELDLEGFRNPLYCLFPQFGGHARVAEVSRSAFIKTTINGEWTSRVQEFINNFRKQDELNRQLQQRQILSYAASFRQFGSPLNRFLYKGKRRF